MATISECSIVFPPFHFLITLSHFVGSLSIIRAVADYINLSCQQFLKPAIVDEIVLAPFSSNTSHQICDVVDSCLPNHSSSMTNFFSLQPTPKLTSRLFTGMVLSSSSRCHFLAQIRGQTNTPQPRTPRQNRNRPVDQQTVRLCMNDKATSWF